MGDLTDWLGEIGEKYGFTSDVDASGTVYSNKTAEGEGKLLTGEIKKDSTGISASGAVGEAETKGDKSTLIGGEYKEGYGESEDGEHWWAGKKASVTGAKREVDFVEKYDLDDNLVIKGDVGAGTASSEAMVTDEGLSLGVQANAVEGSVTLGTTGTGDRDQEARIGLSAGEGAAARVHWGDKDGDENPEYGIGADVGPVSFDIKTEDPLRTGIEAGLNAVPGAGQVIKKGLDLVDGNLTNQAGEMLEDAGDAISDAIWGDDDD